MVAVAIPSRDLGAESPGLLEPTPTMESAHGPPGRTGIRTLSISPALPRGPRGRAFFLVLVGPPRAKRRILYSGNNGLSSTGVPGAAAMGSDGGARGTQARPADREVIPLPRPVAA